VFLITTKFFLLFFTWSDIDNIIFYPGLTKNLIAVLSSPSISTSTKAGIQIKSTPLVAVKPRAIAIALTA
jgi:hypothetical protein